jgi:hypothetical protein
MALMNIVATGFENNIMNIQPTLAIDYLTYDFSGDYLRMTNRSDTICPEYLEIELNSHIDRNNFKNICHKVSFQMEIGGQKILDIPLRFMMHLKDYDICDNKFYVSIPFQMFCDDVRMIHLQFHDVICRLTDTENNFMSCKLISKGIFYTSQIRSEISRTRYEHIIQELSSIELSCGNEGRNEFMCKIPFNGIHKGFYIETANVDEINEIKLELLHHVRSHYNRFLVRAKCVKISQQLLYFPLNYDKSYTDRTIEGFEGSLNLSRIDFSTLNIKLDNPQSKICVYGLGSNKLIYTGGMGGLNFSTRYGHTYEEYNETRTYTYMRTRIPNENIIYKPITNNDKLTCCITQEEISVNARYMRCSRCSNNFDEIAIKNWLRQGSFGKCPMCRATWDDYIVYINGIDAEPVQIEEPEIPEMLDPPIPV